MRDEHLTHVHTANEGPQITFGLIALNAQPFILYNLRTLYPYAHEIIVVEGACPSASAVATEDGHSVDGTLQALASFIADEDPVGKVKLVTAEDEGRPNGFWSEKDEMSQAYATRATGEYLWQVDADEFYRDEDIRSIIAVLRTGVEAVSVPMTMFWGGLDFCVAGYMLSIGGYSEFHRIFAWGPGHAYVTHRPPTVVDGDGRDLRRLRWVRARELRARGVQMFHYSFLIPKQVNEKCEYYARVPWSAQFRDAQTWARRCYYALQTPFHVFVDRKRIAWLRRYEGSHPEQIERMWSDLKSGAFPGISVRDDADIRLLLRRPSYRFACFILQALTPLVMLVGPIWQWAVLSRPSTVLRKCVRRLLRA